NNISLRIGLAYSPSSSWALRAGFGIFYDRYVLAFLNRAVEKDGRQVFEQVADGESATSLFRQAAGGPWPAPLGVLRPSIFQPDPRQGTAFSQQTHFRGQRLVARDRTARREHLYGRGEKVAR